MPPPEQEFNGTDLISLMSNNFSGNGSFDEMGLPQDEYVPYNLRPETYIIPVLFGLIFIVGMAGNGTLIVIFLKHRTMRNVPNM